MHLRLAQMDGTQEERGIVFQPDGTADQIELLLSSSAGVRRLQLDPVRGRLLMRDPG
jgi:hypothetical protein